MEHFTFDYPRYLNAKESVDERALNERVTERFVDELVDRDEHGLRVLEAGAGTGATLRRLLERLGPREGPGELRYCFVEERADNLRAARDQLQEWASATGYGLSEDADRIVLDGRGTAALLDLVRVDFVQKDVFEYLENRPGDPFDAIIAQALLDIVDLDAALETMASHLRAGGLWYLPIHFDGVTALEPTIDPTLDQTIEEHYHRSMNDPQTGRHLLTSLRRTGAHLLDVGASDWIVFGSDGEYPGDEDYFLKCIIYFILNELQDSEYDNDINIIEWARQRRSQIRRGELIYLAHQIDVCARMSR